MAHGASRRQRDPLRVLVVEGDPYLRRLLRRALDQDRRFTAVDEASDVTAAMVCPPGFGVALIDLDLAGLDGRGVIAALHHRNPSPAVVVLSVSGVPYLRYAAAAEGADDFLVRPDDLPRLADRIAEAAAGRGVRSPA